MNLKRSFFYMIVVMVSINAFSTMMYYVGIGPSGIGPAWNQTDMEQNLDANATLTDYSWETAVYSDFIYGTLTFLGVVWGLVVGFPNLLSSSGVPSFITDPLYVVWLLVGFIAVIVGLIGGQDT